MATPSTTTHKITTWTYVKNASEADKAEMLEQIQAENEFQQQEPGGWDENGEDCPITYKLERHGSTGNKVYQMQAYTPSGKMMDGFHESFIRCGNCGQIIDDSGDEPFCWKCFTELDGGYGYK